MIDVAKGQGSDLAKQGELRAIARLLNQRLAAKGAHINLKRKADCLQILLKSPQGSDEELLIELVCQQLQTLKPAGFKTFRIYQPLPGAKSAALIYKSDISPSVPKTADISPVENNNRYSIAQFLAQAHTIEDLRALQKHPFCTDHCPQCGYKFGHPDPLPEYWDCHQCGWTDDLSHLAPRSGGQKLKPRTTQDIKRLGNYLVEANLVTEDQIKVALADQQLTGMRLGDALVKRGWISRETIEYLMKKVILPERTASQDSSYLESSRNLVQTLMTLLPDNQPADSFMAQKSGPEASDTTATQGSHPPYTPSANDRATLVLSEEDLNNQLG